MKVVTNGGIVVYTHRVSGGVYPLVGRFPLPGRQSIFAGGGKRVLIGSFEHMLDAKGRVFIPAKWRESVGDTLVVTIGLLESTNVACLFGMSLEEWERFSQRLSTLAVTDTKGQAIRRKLYSMACGLRDR